MIKTVDYNLSLRPNYYWTIALEDQWYLTKKLDQKWCLAHKNVDSTYD